MSKKLKWVTECVSYMCEIKLFTADNIKPALEFAESLYQTYVVEQGEVDDPCEPSYAVEEDLSYW